MTRDTPPFGGGGVAPASAVLWLLAYLLEAAGPLALARCGAILARRISEAE
jgi:hypothetical protein